MGRSISTKHFRTVCGRFATGVTVVLTQTEEGVHGMTANAFMSVSLDPLIVAVAVHRQGRMAELLRKTPRCRFSLSVLADHQQAVAEYYSRPGAKQLVSAPQGLERILPEHWKISGSEAWIAAAVRTVHEAGDHYMVLADVEGCDLDLASSPLVFYAGHYWEHLDSERDNPIQWQLLEL